MKKHLHQNSKLWDYQILKQLGKGQYGQVFLVQSKKDQNFYALKKVNLSNAHEKEKIQASRQIKALKLIRHPDIIQYYQSFLSLDNIYIVMQYAEKGDFSKIIQQRVKKQKFYTQQQLWEIFGTLASAVKDLHQKSIIHRDIKLQNIFLTKDNKVKLGDLGMVKILHKAQDMLSARVGTPIYFAPQIVQHQLYSFPVDIWSLGCVFYYLTAFQHPFKDATIQTLGYYIVDRDPKPIKGQYSAHLINFVMSLLNKNPNTRPSIFDVALKIRSKNQIKISNKVSIHNIRQLKSIKEILKLQLQQQCSSPLLYHNKSQSPAKKAHYYSDLRNRYEKSLNIMVKDFNQNQSITPSPQKSVQQQKSPRKGETFRNFSMILDKKQRVRPKSIGVQPMIKSNGFSQFKLNKIKIDNRKNSFQMNSLQKAKKEMFPEIPEIQRIGGKTARIVLRGPVL